MIVSLEAVQWPLLVAPPSSVCSSQLSSKQWNSPGWGRSQKIYWQQLLGCQFLTPPSIQKAGMQLHLKGIFQRHQSAMALADSSELSLWQVGEDWDEREVVGVRYWVVGRPTGWNIVLCQVLGRPRHPLRRRSEQRLPPQALPWILPCKGTPSSLDGLQQAARNMRFPTYTLNQNFGGFDFLFCTHFPNYLKIVSCQLSGLLINLPAIQHAFIQSPFHNRSGSKHRCTKQRSKED